MVLRLTVLSAPVQVCADRRRDIAGTVCEWNIGAMPEPASRAGLTMFMDAYTVLGAEPAASPLAIRRAYKRELRNASSDRRGVVESAYLLVREAPLRHHRVSSGADPDRPWSDDELSVAWERAQFENAGAYVLGLTLGLVAIGLYGWLILPLLLTWNYVAGPAIGIILLALLMTFAVSRVPSSVHLWRAIEVYRRVIG